MQAKIYNISLPQLQNNYYKEMILSDMSNNYYWSEDWSEELYVALAKLGFISTTYDTKEGLVLLPELQFEYGILDFNRLHISKRVQKLIDKNDAKLCFNTKFDDVIQNFAIQHKDNWFKKNYVELIKALYKNNKKYENFEICSVELISNKTEELIAGEIGYKIGKVYTSLSGFSSREKRYNNYGKLQLVLLSKHLQSKGFEFWNLGHPHMLYKQKLGSVTHSRKEFLIRWEKAT